MIGANVSENGSIQFKVWAPKANSLSLILLDGQKETVHPLKQCENGFYVTSLPKIEPLPDYLYCINGEKRYPDPASFWQPHGVHGPSRVYDNRQFEWKDIQWKGIALDQYLIYELHVGTFTQEGSFEAIINKLPHLKQLGITAIELMPIATFPGKRNWGYDGVYPYAPHHDYGGPEGLKKLVSACHQEGFAVILDVVYNHLGCEGNYLGSFGHYFTDRYKTPWGEAVNFDSSYSDIVRDYFIQNALFWMREYHVDAIRLDAIHAIFDFSAYHFLEELTAAVHQLSLKLKRPLYVIAESDLNDVRILKSIEKGGYAIDSQWSDEFHHSVYAYLTQSQWRYFSDFGQLSQLGKAITEGFVYQGQYSQFRKKHFGSCSKELPGKQFVICIQNHDQVGNAGLGKRLTHFVSAQEYRLATMLLLFSPNIPMLFMGQEWGAATPFHYFASYQDEHLQQAVREGYAREFDLEQNGIKNYDPHEIHYFELSKLDWKEIEKSEHADLLDFYKKAIKLRKEIAALSNNDKKLTKIAFDEDQKWLVIERSDHSGSQAILMINFSQNSQVLEVAFSKGHWTMELSSFDKENLAPKQFCTQSETNIRVELLPKNGLLYSNSVLKCQRQDV